MIVIGIISVLSSAVILAINPARQFKLARDSKRTTDVNAILNAVGQNMAENKGIFVCEGVAATLPKTITNISSSGGFNLSSCLVPTYFSSIPYDPNQSGAHYNNSNDYDSKYSLIIDDNDHLKILAQSEIDPTKPISAIR